VILRAQLEYDFAANARNSKSNTDDQVSEVLNKDYLNSLYFRYVASPVDIVNGKEYFLYSYNSKTTPLLFSGRAFNSTLSTDGRIYKNVSLQYDTYSDEVVYSDTSRVINFQYPKVMLAKEFVEWFTFYTGTDTIHFQNLRFGDEIRNRPDDGYYEIAYDGTSKYIIRHRSKQYESIRDATIEYKYVPQNIFIINNTAYTIKRKKDFLQMFGNESSDIKEYMHRMRISLKRAGKKEITGIIKYYETLAD
jgi:hypothetical protein